MNGPQREKLSRVREQQRCRLACLTAKRNQSTERTDAEREQILCLYKWASMRENLSSGVCEQQRCSSVCAFAQSDQRLCYSFFGKYHI